MYLHFIFQHMQDDSRATFVCCICGCGLPMTFLFQKSRFLCAHCLVIYVDSIFVVLECHFCLLTPTHSQSDN